jgi:hypothetical protein
MFTLKSISRISKGGEMMKTFGLVLVMVVLFAGVSVADVCTYDTYPGWNLIAAPLVPFDPAPESVLGTFDLMFTAGLLRFDAPTQAQLAYDPWAMPDTVFGSILLGDGYWLYNPDAGVVSYSGVPDGVPDALGAKTDMWISLPGNQADGVNAGGWHLIGCPFNTDVPIDPNWMLNGEGVLFTDGTTVKNWSEAAAAGWVADSALYFDGAAQAQFSTGYFFNDDDHFRAGKGYWVKTNVDNLAMILPAP